MTALLLAVGISLPGAGPLMAQQADVAALLQELREAEPGQDARIISQIFTEWSKSGSAAVDLMLRRGEDALDAGDYDAAIEHLTAAIDHDPAFAEAYHGRATAYYLTDQIGPALDDLRQTLVLNPDHFLAMQGFGVILSEMGRTDDALEVLQRVHEMHPADPDVTLLIDQLEMLESGFEL